MKKLLCFLGLLVVANVVSAAETNAAFASERDRVSYCLGMTIALNLQNQGAEVNQEQLFAAIRDVLSGGTPKMSREEMSRTLQAWHAETSAKKAARDKALAETNRKQGDDYLAANAKKPGVKTSKTGLQYKVLASGQGASPKPTDMVKFHYKGALIDGTEFDNSFTRGEPLTMPANHVIPAWAEALSMMKVGDRWQLFVPAKLAYGDQGLPGKVPPGAALVFEMQLLGVEQGKARPSGLPPGHPTVPGQ